MTRIIGPYRFLAEWRVVVCVDCRLCNVADEVETHLTQHKQMTIEQRREISRKVRCIPGIRRNQNDLKDFEFPPAEYAAHPLLEVATDCIGCLSCPFICRDLKRMKRHCRSEHRWKNTQTRGRIAAKNKHLVEASAHWREGVRGQRFFQQGYASSWFEVDKPTEVSSDGNNEALRNVWSTSWDGKIEKHEAVLKSEREERQRFADTRTGVDFESTWIRKLGVAKHLGKYDMRAMWQATGLPLSRAARASVRDESIRLDQQRLAQLTDGFDRVIAHCSRRLDLVPEQTLAWLGGINAQTQSNRLFGLKENGATTEKYKERWKAYLCYCVRACRLGAEEAEKQRGIRFNEDQWEALSLLTELVDEYDGKGIGRDVGDGFEDSGIDLMEDERAEWEAALDKQVFRFSIASIKQVMGGKGYRNPLVHFMGVVAWDGVKGTWYSNTGTVTAWYAGLLWCARLLKLENIFGVELSIDQAEDPDDMTEKATAYFKTQFEKWMVRGTYGPVSIIIEWMAYGKGHRNREGGMPRLMWHADEKTMQYLGQPLKTVDFCRAARTGLTEASTFLDRVLGGHWTELERGIDLARIKDDLMKGAAGNSFVTQRGNDWLRCGPRRLMDLIGHKLWNAERNEWRVSAVIRWLSCLREFKMAHLGNVHIWGGQPGRGPEVMTMRHCDGQQLIRNVFVFDGQVFLVTDRDKSKAIRDIGIKVARFLHESVGKMMIAYIAWVLPLECLLLREKGLYNVIGRGTASGVEVSDKASREKERNRLLSDGWLWADLRPGFKGRWSTDELSKRLISLMGRFADIELGVSDYRHVSIEMGRKIKGIVVRQVEAEDDGGDDYDETQPDEQLVQMTKFDFVFDLQSTHGRRIAGQHYAVNNMFPNNLQPDKVASFREVSRLWHCFLEQKPSRTEVVEDGAHEQQQLQTPPSSVAEGSRSNTKRTFGATELGEDRASVPARKKHKPATGQDDITEDRAVDNRAVERGLRALIGSRAARWKSAEQKEGMRRIMAMRGGEVLIVVLPTGGGKSVFFTLPALLPSTREEVDVVIVPFIALADDIVKNAVESGIDCIRWQSAAVDGREHPQRAPQLLVVSADLAETEEFIMHADMLRAQGKLRRIFVDECHTVIMDVSYRRKLEKLRGIHRYGCPVVLLTATLPVGLEGWFRTVMIAEDADMIRASTVKLNIRYRVVKVKGGRSGMEKAVMVFAGQLGERMGGDQKGVIYCRSQKQTGDLAKALRCGAYHSDMSAKSREEVLASWVEGQSDSRWIVATTGLGTGVNIKGIVAVIHADKPYGLVDFMQQTGRGGRREGETVESIIVLQEGRQAWMDECRNDAEQANCKAIERFIEAEGCRRVGLGEFMDGCGRSCSELAGAERCDRCKAVDWESRGVDRSGDDEDEGGNDDTGSTSAGPAEISSCLDDKPGHTGSQDSANAFSEDQRKRHTRLELLRRWLIRVEGRCGTCYIRWLRQGAVEERRSQYKHRLTRCKTAPKDEYLRWRQQIKFADGACCWKCGLPESWCTAAETGVDCMWKDQVLPLIMSTTTSTELRKAVMEEFGEDTFRAESYTEWLGRSARLYGLDMTNALRVWDFIVARYFTEEEQKRYGL